MEQKKLLYFSVVDVEGKGFAGVSKKVRGQVEAFQNLGFDTYLLCFASSELVLFHGEEKTVYRHFSFCGFHRTLQLYGHLSDLCRENHFDILYIRYPLCDWWFYRALAKSRENIGKIILEIPTYPYDVENEKNHNWVTQFCLRQDRYLRYKLNHLVDLIVTYGNVKENRIFDIPACVIYNSVPAKTCQKLHKEPHETLNFIAVANLMFHHRYDKVLRGMAEYLKQQDADQRLRFHIVGDGPEKKNLANLTNELELSKYVFFHGIQTGDNLMELYKQADLGLVEFEQITDSNRIAIIDCLKYSEYCSIGLPHASSALHSCYPCNSSFFCLANTDERAVDIRQLVDFAKSVNLNQAQEDMYEIVMNNLTWDHSMKHVLNVCMNL